MGSVASHPKGSKKSALVVAGAILAFMVLTLALALARAGSGDRDSGESPDASSHAPNVSSEHATEETDARSDAGDTTSRQERAETVEMDVRSLTVAPPQGDKWSAWVRVPPRTRTGVCPAKEDSLECASTESDLSKFPVLFQCRDVEGRIHDWSQEACGDRDHIAYRMKSKSDSAVRMARWLEPY